MTNTESHAIRLAEAAFVEFQADMARNETLPEQAELSIQGAYVAAVAEDRADECSLFEHDLTWSDVVATPGLQAHFVFFVHEMNVLMDAHDYPQRFETVWG